VAKFLTILKGKDEGGLKTGCGIMTNETTFFKTVSRHSMLSVNPTSNRASYEGKVLIEGNGQLGRMVQFRSGGNRGRMSSIS